MASSPADCVPGIGRLHAFRAGVITSGQQGRSRSSDDYRVAARRFGFDGKSALHPGQLGAINEIFDVSPEEKVWAEKVLAELDTAEDRGRALSTLGGRLIDNPHRIAAERMLRRARLAQK